ncbi:uncharacterized protein LOC119578442 [Penaeus monodon]|uniref:uncharacterized protein LOC119578442 n=1 Tax=Penaeus monodon TaxID=6687 RepID=UPI0018A7D9D0|nr:uncharacterized protein LOC119578442 [Penaeus monodon]
MSSTFAEATNLRAIFVAVDENVANIYLNGSASLEEVNLREIFEKGVSECHIYKSVGELQQLTLPLKKRRMPEPVVSAEKRRRMEEPVASTSGVTPLTVSDADTREVPAPLQPRAFLPELSPTSPAYYPGRMQRPALSTLNWK